MTNSMSTLRVGVNVPPSAPASPRPPPPPMPVFRRSRPRGRPRPARRGQPATSRPGTAGGPTTTSSRPCERTRASRARSRRCCRQRAASGAAATGVAAPAASRRQGQEERRQPSVHCGTAMFRRCATRSKAGPKLSPHADMRTPLFAEAVDPLGDRTAGAPSCVAGDARRRHRRHQSGAPHGCPVNEVGRRRPGDRADEDLLIRIRLERPELVLDRDHRDQHALVLRRNAPGQRHDVGGVAGGRPAAAASGRCRGGRTRCSESSSADPASSRGTCSPWCRTAPIPAAPSNRLRSSPPRRTETLRAAGTPGSRRGRAGRRRPGRARPRRAGARSRSPIRRAARCTRTRLRSCRCSSSRRRRSRCTSRRVRGRWRAQAPRARVLEDAVLAAVRVAAGDRTVARAHVGADDRQVQVGEPGRVFQRAASRSGSS